MLGFATGREFKLGRPFGIPLTIQAWLAYMVGGIAGFAILSRRVMDGTWILVLFASILLHEWGHALGARWAGDVVHRVTLHLLGGVTYRGGRTTPSQDLGITAAGPLVNVALAASAYLALRFAWDSLHPVSAVLLWQVLWANVLLAAFNVLPIYPMDGGTMARLLFERWLGRGPGTRIALGLSIVTLAAAAAFLIATGAFGLLAVIILVQLFMMNVLEMKTSGAPSVAEFRTAVGDWRRRRAARRDGRREERRAERAREDRDARVVREGPRLLDRALDRGVGTLDPEERRLLLLHRRLVEIRVDSAEGSPAPADLALLEKHVMLGARERLN